MTSRSRTSIPIALLALALLVPAASARAATERTISVTANATLKVPNDSAGLGFAVSRERRTRGAALRAVAAGLRGVIAVAEATPGVG
ncbi:MAG TPA: SIMPL domain-containing protein, partial [Solirubrobacterales bacterium]|nr:SIMPL domain-containing protein [Solirubrobacterales bacterium]